MSSGQGHSNGYRATSIDFINRPNPVEPSNVGNSGNHSINGRSVGRPANEDLLRVLLGARQRDPVNEASTRPAKVSSQQVSSGSIAAVLNDDQEPSTFGAPLLRHSGRDLDQNLYTLPELPPKRGIKRPRQRVPPVLQGLHQPPPNAGLLPSISTEEARTVSTSTNIGSFAAPSKTQSSELPVPFPDTKDKDVLVPSRPAKRNKWTDGETEMLLEGVKRFGIGNWKKMLDCQDLQFSRRTPVDLKDRFRMWTQKQNRLGKAVESPSHQSDVEANTAHHDAAPISTTDTTTQPFLASKRRPRKVWTDAEDDALLRGFRKYGRSWTSIQIDPVLKTRTSTDIRDRIRIKFPQDYGKEGLVPKRTKSSVRPSDHSSPSDLMNAEPDRGSETSGRNRKETQGAVTSDGTKALQPNSLALPSFDDRWLADLDLPGDDEDAEADPIVLDRSIFEWADRQLPSLPSIFNTDPGGHQGIDPLATLLPKPSQ